MVDSPLDPSRPIGQRELKLRIAGIKKRLAYMDGSSERPEMEGSRCRVSDSFWEMKEPITEALRNGGLLCGRIGGPRI